MTYPLGGDSSKYSYVSFAVSFLMSILLAFVWREQVYGDRDSTRLSPVSNDCEPVDCICFSARTGWFSAHTDGSMHRLSVYTTGQCL